MKNKRGFTLVELLAVIIILGLLSSIAVIATLKVKKVQDAKNNANMLAGVFTGVKKYVSENPYYSGTTGVTINELISGNYTDVDDTKIPLSTVIYATEGADACSNSYKRAFYANVDGNYYNDCGCREQDDSITKSKTICQGKNGTTQIDSIEITN